MQKSHRIEYLDVFKSFGIILMVMGHVYFGATFDKLIHGFHMPMFFFVSGMLYKMKYKDGLCNKELLSFIKKKGYSLLLPYAFFGVLLYSIWLILNYSASDKLNFLFHLLFINNTGLEFASVLWFLTALFITEIVFALIDVYVFGKIKYVFLILITLCGHLAEYISIDFPYSMTAGFAGVSMFSFGVLFMKYKNTVKLVGKFEHLRFLSALLLGVLGGLIILYNDSVNMRAGTYGNIFLYYIGALAAIFTGINISRYFTLLFNHNTLLSAINVVIQRIGKNSITFLCLNQLIIKLFSDVLNGRTTLLLNGSAGMLVYKMVIFCMTMLSLYIIDWVIRRSGFSFMLGVRINEIEKNETLLKSPVTFIIYGCVVGMLFCYSFYLSSM